MTTELTPTEAPANNSTAPMAIDESAPSPTKTAKPVADPAPEAKLEPETDAELATVAPADVHPDRAAVLATAESTPAVENGSPAPTRPPPPARRPWTYDDPVYVDVPLPASEEEAAELRERILQQVEFYFSGESGWEFVFFANFRVAFPRRRWGDKKCVRPRLSLALRHPALFNRRFLIAIFPTLFASSITEENLGSDTYLRNLIEAHKLGWVSISTLMAFNRMRPLCSDLAFVASALEASKELLEIDRTRTCVRLVRRYLPRGRTATFTFDDPVERSVVVKGLPTTLERFDELKALFSQIEPVRYTFIQKQDWKCTGTGFLTFNTAEGAKRVAAMTDLTFEESPLTVAMMTPEDARSSNCAYYCKRENPPQGGFRHSTWANQGLNPRLGTNIRNYPPDGLIRFEGVSNLTFVDDVKEFFGAVEPVRFVSFATGALYGYVLFEQPQAAYRVIQKLGYSIPAPNGISGVATKICRPMLEEEETFCSFYERNKMVPPDHHGPGRRGGRGGARGAFRGGDGGRGRGSPRGGGRGGWNGGGRGGFNTNNNNNRDPNLPPVVLTAGTVAPDAATPPPMQAAPTPAPEGKRKRPEHGDADSKPPLAKAPKSEGPDGASD
ncbi:hypothetical protein BDK51DRAFT_37648 [Blyttiomyces helicus]|uniref:RRM domain-containing protein n=1 Tax=Blyttiomyces helicus TaxID=388810 RepID=A0A4P9W1G9_9FUNG|nr:hypothetical protein BDK51DRAFT_37648 [Blyttiomyces helicus]|eukprot:RKO86031.1 hypothetical protein BDK51DRAFT_37648 [Blyttiomyces helicus]